VTLDDEWTIDDMLVIRRDIRRTAKALADLIGSENPAETFKAIYGNITIEVGNLEGTGCQSGTGGFACNKGSVGKLKLAAWSGTVIHELAHVFDFGYCGYNCAQDLETRVYAEDGTWVAGGYFPNTGLPYRTTDGYRSPRFPDMQHPMSLDGAGFNGNFGEDYADMFMNFIIDPNATNLDLGFANNPAGNARYNWIRNSILNALLP
jgi:hypothetical protein